MRRSKKYPLLKLSISDEALICDKLLKLRLVRKNAFKIIHEFDDTDTLDNYTLLSMSIMYLIEHYESLR